MGNVILDHLITRFKWDGKSDWASNALNTYDKHCPDG